MASRVITMLSRCSTDLLHASVVISELPALRRMPTPTPLPTLARPGWMERANLWLAARREAQSLPQRSAQVLVLRA